MPKLKLTRKSTAIVAAGLLTVATAGGAYAYWTTTGSGTGSAATGTSTAVAVTQVGSISAMTPGSAAQAVDFTINNTATTNQFVTSVLVSISGVTGPNISVSTPCAPADYTLVQPTAISADLTPGTHPYSPSGSTLQLTNSASNQDGCKGATVALSFSAR